MSGSRAPWVLVLVVLTATLAISNKGFLDGVDESREAGMAREMALTGDVVTPRLDGEPFLEKPPLFYAAAAACLRVLGPSERAARVAPGLFAIVALLSTFALARNLSGSFLGGAIAAVALGTSLRFQDAAHSCVTNIAIATSTAVALYALERTASTERWGLSAVLYHAALAVGFLSKNLVGVALPGVATLAYAALARDGRVLRRLFLSPAPIAFLLPVVPWIASLYLAGQAEPPGGRGLAFLREALVDNNIGRYFDGYGGHSSPTVRDSFEWLAGSLVPWTPAAILALVSLAIEFSRGTPAERRRAALLLAATLAPFALISSSQSKRMVYMVMVLPAFAAAIGVFWQRVSAGPAGRAGQRLLRGLAAGGAIAATAGPAALAWLTIQAGAVPDVTTAVLGAATLILLGSAVVLARRLDFERLGLVAAAATLSLACAGLVPAIRADNGRESDGEFYSQVAALVPQGELGAIGCYERELGAAYFYLGRRVTQIGEGRAQDVSAFLARPDAAGVIVAAPKGDDVSDTLDETLARALGPPPWLDASVRMNWCGGRRRLLFLERGARAGDHGDRPRGPCHGKPHRHRRRARG